MNTKSGYTRGLGQETPPAPAPAPKPKPIRSYLRISTQKAEVMGPAPVKGVRISILGPDEKTHTAQIPDDEYRFELPYPVGTPVVVTLEAPGREQRVFAAKTFDDESRGHTIDMRLAEPECPTVGILIGVGLLILIGCSFFVRR